MQKCTECKHDVDKREMRKGIAQFVGNLCAAYSDLIFSDQRNAP